ncbi:protein of unknown function DUF58 [Candidatus Magnetoovum chiemensis]|nr:protein of unknown function DUF58 [Candidatus Magnetoovum chiemensis]
MLPAEVIKNIRKIQIKTKRLVKNGFAGRYHSVFKGQGMEFDEVRQYQPGDDIRSIDWNVTARMGEPFIKKFVEERELTIIFLLDLSLSCAFATVNQLKRTLAAELFSVLALSALNNNDKAGLIAFTDRIEKALHPKKGMQHVLRVIREALYLTPESSGTNIKTAIEYLNKITKRRTITFIISDFYDETYEKALTIAAKRHDIIAITITDPVEVSLPNAGLIALEDAETGESFLIDSSSSLIRQRYEEKAKTLFDKRRELFQSINVDHIDIRTNIPYAQTLIKFFATRQKRLSH